MAKVNYEGPEQFRPLGAWEGNILDIPFFTVFH